MGYESIAYEAEVRMGYRRIFADVIVDIFAH